MTLGTAEGRHVLSRPYGTCGSRERRDPGDESPGYYQMSLRDIARPGDGGPEMWVIARPKARANSRPGAPGTGWQPPRLRLGLGFPLRCVACHARALRWRITRRIND